MGQSLDKYAAAEQIKDKDILLVIEQSYDNLFVRTENWSSADFYQAVSQTVEEINKKMGSTQFRVPKTSTLEHAYRKHHKDKEKSITREEFKKILQEVILDSGITNVGAKDMLFYLYGVPLTALLLKQRFVPKSIPNQVFIPCVTSATVYLLAMLKKL